MTLKEAKRLARELVAHETVLTGPECDAIERLLEAIEHLQGCYAEAAGGECYDNAHDCSPD